MYYLAGVPSRVLPARGKPAGSAYVPRAGGGGPSEGGGPELGLQERRIPRGDSTGSPKHSVDCFSENQPLDTFKKKGITIS